MTAPYWHRLDPTDAHFAYATEHVFVGLALPGLATLRERLRTLAAANPAVLRMTDGDSRWRLLSADELRAAPERLVVASEAREASATLAATAATPLEGASVAFVLGSGWLGVRVFHACLFDGGSILEVLRSLLVPGEAGRPLRVVPTWRRRAMLTAYLGTHPRAVRAAFAHGADRSSAAYLPAPTAPAEEPAVAHVCSAPHLAGQLRRLRDERWPGASVGSVVLAGFRGAMARAGALPLPGGEVLFDVRRYFPRVPALLGNWASGVDLRPEDDFSPLSVTRAVQRAASSGLPVAAMAAGHVVGLGRRDSVLDRPVRAPRGCPRLTFSFLGAHSAAVNLPWRSDRPTHVLDRTRPANAEAITLIGREIGGRLSLSASHYGSVWPTTTVQEALGSFLHDPCGTLRWAQRELRQREVAG